MVERWLHLVFSKAKGERFEDGMESDFSRQLESAIRQYGLQAICEIDHLINGAQSGAEVASEALRWIGLLSHPPTHKYRLWVLKKSLSSESPRIRDGALLGISFLDDPEAIDALREAIQKESQTELKLDMERVLQQLEDTRRCQST
ncbi:MAG TPA: HEAT repeat domain-containing protein [Planctomycetota bacterium]|nr:HEAT repeat domain-containing protein [Planctomycetota bacterium]